MPTPARPGQMLSIQEQKIVVLLAQGLDNHQISDQLGISTHTTRSYMRRMAAKMECSGHAHMVHKAYLAGLLDGLPPETRQVHPLTGMGRAILFLMADGHTDEDISRRLFRSVGTIKTHVRVLLKSMGAKNRHHAVSLAHQLGLMKEETG